MLPSLLRRPSRLGVVMALLVLTLGLASALAWQAHQAARSHREAAGRVLRDYVEFAGWEFSRAARHGLDGSISRWLGAVSCAAQQNPLPAPADVDCGDITPRSIFLIGSDGTFQSTGEPLDPDARHAIAAAARPALNPGVIGGQRAVRVVSIGERPSLIAAATIRRHRTAIVEAAGFVADLDVIAPPLESVMRETPLLPPTLVTAGNDLLGIRVQTDTGIPVFEFQQLEQEIRASGALDDPVAGLVYDVSLNRDAASNLVIGGLPRSRLPLLLGMLAVTAGLVVVAGLQLRREHDLSRMRSDFVSSVSHELRTPLAQIRLFSETLLLGRVRSDAEARRSLEIIQQESRRLTHLVENVLYFSRGERGTSRLSTAPARLANMIGELVEAFAPLAQARRSAIRVELRDDVVAPVDGGAIRQILLNLLDNAVKYGSPGQTITVTLTARDNRAVIAVEDEGPGVPPDAWEHIWAPYTRLAPAADSAVAGTGIGLAVVRDLASQHGGTCHVEAGARGGARFVLEIPRAVPAALQAPIGESRALA